MDDEGAELAQQEVEARADPLSLAFAEHIRFITEKGKDRPDSSPEFSNATTYYLLLSNEEKNPELRGGGVVFFHLQGENGQVLPLELPRTSWTPEGYIQTGKSLIDFFRKLNPSQALSLNPAWYLGLPEEQQAKLGLAEINCGTPDQIIESVRRDLLSVATEAMYYNHFSDNGLERFRPDLAVESMRVAEVIDNPEVRKAVGGLVDKMAENYSMGKSHLKKLAEFREAA